MTFDKKQLRATALAARDAVFEDEAIAFSRRLADVGLELARAYGAEAVSLFASIGSEPIVAFLMLRLHQLGFVVSLPVTGKVGTPLTFRRWTPEMLMKEGRMGILEPPPEADVVEPDLMFVPLAAFDRRGHRIGYGAGFYDRTIAALRAKKQVVTVGIAYAVQEVLFVPDDAHDEPLDMIVTERETILTTDDA